MERINSLSDLLMEELADLLSAENQLTEALPKITEASQSSELKAALQDCLEISKKHANRLQEIFGNIGQNPPKRTCKAMKGLIAESHEVLSKTQKGRPCDAAITEVAQRIQQYEITRYKAVREHASDLGHTKIVELLSETLEEDRSMNFNFNELAQGMINVQAIDSKSSSKDKKGGFYIPEGRFSRGSIKKKNKNTDVSRFINEGNPNAEPPTKGEEKEEDQN